MRLNALYAVAAILCALSAAAPAAEYRQTITLREPLGRTWADELVHYDLAIPQPKVAAATLSLTDEDGNPAPVQVEVLENKPDGVRRVRLWLKTTLVAEHTVTYTVAWNDNGRKAARPGPSLTVRRGDGRLLVLAGTFELMIPAPDKPFEKPVPLKAAPAPILGLRPAGEQAWYGVWSLDGAAYVRAVRTTIEASGPLWAQVRVRYVFDQPNQSYDVALRVVYGEPWVDVSERFRIPPAAGTVADKAAACRMTAAFRGRLPAEALWMPWYIGRGEKSQPAYDLCPLVPDRPSPAGLPLATLRPRFTQVPDATQVLLTVGRDDAGPAVGVIMTSPNDWVRPYENFPAARFARATPASASAKAEGDGVAIDFPLTDGKRRWALVMAPKDRLDSKAKVQALIRRAADLPLDRVLGDWILTWRRGKAAPSPHLLTTWDRLRRLREDLTAGKETPVTKLLVMSLSGGLPADRRLAELLAGRREAPESFSAPPFTPLPAAGEGAGVRGESTAVPGVAPVLTQCYQSPDLALPAWPRGLPEALIEADLAAAGRAPAEGELSTSADAALALLAYVFTDPNYQPGAAAGWEQGDLAEDMYVVPLYVAAMIPDHPHAPRWASAALAAMRDRLRRAAGPPGDAAALAQVLASMRMAQNGRLEDPFRWPEVRPALEFLMSLHSPPDPRLGRRDLAPFVVASSPDRKVGGASARGAAPPAAAWHDGVGALFGLAAAGFREPDPKFAAQCMAMYQNYAGSGAGGGFAAAFAAAEAGGAASLDPAAWAGREWPGFGAVLRSRFGADRETMAVFRCGPSRTPDQMAFHFFGAGMPLALAWHAGPPLRIDQDALYNRMSVGEGENMDAPAELLAFQSTPAADVVVGQMQATVLRKLPRFPHEIAGASAYPRRTLVSETRWRRYMALVKHGGGPLEDYLVIRDELVSAEPEAFNLWVLARSVRQDGRLFYFDGQLAADAVAFVASPDVDRIKVEQWSWPRQDESGMVPAGFGTSSEEAAKAGVFPSPLAGEGGRRPGEGAFFAYPTSADFDPVMPSDPSPAAARHPLPQGERKNAWADSTLLLPGSVYPPPQRLTHPAAPVSAAPAAPPAAWRTGELQQRLRIRGSPGEDYLVVLYPYRKGSPVPEFQVLSGGKGVRVSLGGASEDIYLAADPPPEAGGQAVVRRAGQTTVILKSGALPPLAKAVAE